MAQLTVRNVSEEIVRELRIRAARNGRSAEAEHRLILAETLRGETDDFWAQAGLLRDRSGKQRSDSGVLLRAMRDKR